MWSLGSYDVWSTSCNHSGRDLVNGGGCGCVATRDIWELWAFAVDLKTSLFKKYMHIYGNKKFQVV